MSSRAEVERSDAVVEGSPEVGDSLLSALSGEVGGSFDSAPRRRLAQDDKRPGVPGLGVIRYLVGQCGDHRDATAIFDRQMRKGAQEQRRATVLEPLCPSAPLPLCSSAPPPLCSPALCRFRYNHRLNEEPTRRPRILRRFWRSIRTRDADGTPRRARGGVPQGGP